MACIHAGQEDTLDQLRWAYSNIALDEQFYKAPTVVDEGEVPEWLDGKSPIYVTHIIHILLLKYKYIDFNSFQKKNIYFMQFK